jgi:hypothetical protein
MEALKMDRDNVRNIHDYLREALRNPIDLPTDYNIEGVIQETEAEAEQPTEPEDPLYNRQSSLNLSIPDKVVVIGVGGIGSHVAMNMGLIGVKKLYLIDYDVIEEHNLNRTLFRDIDIDTKKIEAISDLLLERRSDIDVRVFDKRLEELTTLELNELSDSLILDCRDVLEELPEALKDNETIKLGYDGLSVTMILNPDYNAIWEVDENRGYQVIPSFLAPCQFLATAVTTLITNPDFNMGATDNKVVTFDINKHFVGIIGD